ncbi:MAG: M20 family peptidase [Myxococcota bacterium]
MKRLLLTVAGALVAAAAAAETPEARLAKAITFETISHQDDADFAPAPFEAMEAWLTATYPGVHATLGRERVGRASLLYHWPGRDASLAPILLASHLDVVPVPDPGSWTHPPFDGVIADGFVWGRGAIDDKAGAMGILEALERLVAEGFTPERGLWISFGHDEEVGGEHGAKAVAALLAERGVRAWFCLDEGMAIAAPGATSFSAKPLALVGVAEKGYLTLRLTARGAGGHSSVPPPSTAIGRLSLAITRLEARPLEARTQGVVADMMAAIAPHTSGLQRLALSWPRLFAPVIESQLVREPSTNAMVRTTTAVTMIDGGVKANVLPREANARVNFRLLPGDTSEMVVAHVREAIDDPEIEITVETANEASPVADVNSEAFARLSEVILEQAPDAVVAPALVVGGTDTRHYVRVADDGFRFLPIRFAVEDFERIHGRDERIAIENYHFAIDFYEKLVRRTAGGATVARR